METSTDTIETMSEADCKQKVKLSNWQTVYKMTDFKSHTEYMGNACCFKFTDSGHEAILRR